jgi:hypothetical protein
MSPYSNGSKRVQKKTLRSLSLHYDLASRVELISPLLRFLRLTLCE